MPETINELQNKRVDDPVGLDELLRHETGFRARHPLIWHGTLLGPLFVSLLLLVLLALVAGWEFASRLVVATALSLWLLGRFIILSGADSPIHDFDGAMSSFQLFMLISYLDAMTALTLAFHIGFLFRLPIIGPRVAALVADGHFILKSNPWMRSTTYLGLIAFVGFPLAATGSVGGSVFGRLLGLGRFPTFCCIVTGSLLGNGLMYLFSDALGAWIDKDNPAIKYGGIVVLILIIVLLERRYRDLKSRFTKSEHGASWPCQKICNE